LLIAALGAENEVLSVGLVCLGVAVLLCACAGHKIVGCPPFWLLLLDSCFPRRILARLAPKYFFICECKHPDHQRSTKTFSDVHPADQKGCAHGWVFSAKLQPGIKDIARCKFCSHHHDEWCVNLKQIEEEKLEEKLHNHLSIQLDAHSKDTRHELHTQESGNVDGRRQQEEALKAHASSHEATTANHLAMLTSLEEQVQAHVRDAHQKWETQYSDNTTAQQRYGAFESSFSKGQQDYESLDEKFQAHVRDMYSEFQANSSERKDLKDTLSKQQNLNTAMETQLKAHSEDSVAMFEIQLSEDKQANQLHIAAIEEVQAKQLDMHQALDMELRVQLKQVHDELEAAQLAESSQVRKRHGAVQEALGGVLGMHEALEEKLQSDLVDISAQFAAQQREADEQKQRSHAALEASAAQQYDLHETLVERLQVHAQATDSMFEAKAVENAGLHRGQDAALEAAAELLGARHDSLETDLLVHVENTRQQFEVSSNERNIIFEHTKTELAAAASHRTTLFQESKEHMQAHEKVYSDELNIQQEQNREVQRQHAAMEMKESRQFGRHEQLVADVKTLRIHQRKVNEGFEGQHAKHLEVQDASRSTTLTEYEEYLASTASASAAFEHFKGLTSDQIRKHDLALQRLYNELGSTADQLGKQQMGIQRVYAELGISQITMPTSWGSPHPQSPKHSPKQSPIREGAMSR